MTCPNCLHLPSDGYDRGGLHIRCKCHCHDVADAAPDLLAACEAAVLLSQHADGCGWWSIPLATLNESERSQAEQREKCTCHLKQCREAITKATQGADQ